MCYCVHTSMHKVWQQSFRTRPRESRADGERILSRINEQSRGCHLFFMKSVHGQLPSNLILTLDNKYYSHSLQKIIFVTTVANYHTIHSQEMSGYVQQT